MWTPNFPDWGMKSGSVSVRVRVCFFFCVVSTLKVCVRHEALHWATDSRLVRLEEAAGAGEPLGPLPSELLGASLLSMVSDNAAEGRKRHLLWKL